MNSGDEVLSLEDSDENSFSGFSSVDSGNVVPEKKKKKLKSSVVKVKKGRATKSSVSKASQKEKCSQRTPKYADAVSEGKKEGTAECNSVLDVSKLSHADLQKLKEALGIPNVGVPADLADDNDFENVFGPMEDLPNMTIEVDRNAISDDEENQNPNIMSGMSKALFEQSGVDDVNDEVWGLPKLKTPQKGKPVSHSLAQMINMSCTSQCEVESIISKYKIPENCNMACPPMVNNEIWKVMDRRTQSQDRGISDAQNLVTAGITPILKLADVLKSQITNNEEAKTLIADSLVLLGQVQYTLSLKRRYMIRPVLKKKYYSLCNMSMPITTKLFGDDVAKDIKSCDSLNFIGKEQYPRFPSSYTRGRAGNQRFQRRGYGGSGYNSGRFQPYPPRGQPQGRFMARNPGYRIPKRAATSTVPAPNDQN